MLRRLDPDRIPDLRRDPVTPETRRAAESIVDDVRARGETALREQATRFGDLPHGAPLVVERAELEWAAHTLLADDRALLERTAERILTFAQAQRNSHVPIEVEIPGGRAGLRWAPVERAGCYAPGGRFPLPSSVLMTAVTARVAGVAEVWVASPRPSVETRAAAWIAGADALLAVGGAQAIAALAYGAGVVPACDMIVGPGNRWVTAAKQLVAGQVSIDMLAGPSELVVLADTTADPELVAADLLAQAEHDPDALPIVVATSSAWLEGLDRALVQQLIDLPTAATARESLRNGFAVVVGDVEAGVAICDRLAPEHLALHVEDPRIVRPRHYGALFVGGAAAEVLGDYGAGPNHVLPTGGTARSTGGLSVATFLRAQTWLRVDDPDAARGLASDASRLARCEGLEAHARAADRRCPGPGAQGAERLGLREELGAERQKPVP